MGLVNTKDEATDPNIFEKVVATNTSQEVIVPETDTTYDTVQQLAKVGDLSTIRDTYNIDDDADTIRSIISALNGSSIKVTYYQRLEDSILRESSSTDISPSTDPLHLNLVCIHNFDIKLSEDFAYGYDTISNISDFKGAGICYPGFEPSKGDIFLYKVADRLGMFKITDTQRLSIAKQSTFKITFELFNFAVGHDVDLLQKSVIKDLYFDRDTYLSGADALMDSKEYKVFNDIKSLIDKLIKFYFKTFYDPVHLTILRKDNVYDVFIIEFINRFISIRESGNIPNRYSESIGYEATIWGLFDNDLGFSIKDLQPWLYLHTKTHSSSDIKLCSLVGHDFIQTDISIPDVPQQRTELYIFSQLFYERNDKKIPIDPGCVKDRSECMGYQTALSIDPKASLHTMEKIIIAYVEKTVNMEHVIEYAKKHRSFSDHDKFYHIPMLIWIMKEYLNKFIY
ncbi:MAG: hypothetical protein GY804_09345 [Alphaproteobacteria bacterium]|nr:hypothetical protein [Alphaproteobacteria bacterium]